MEVTMFFPLLLLICSHSTAQPQPESDNEMTPLGDNQTRQPANLSLPRPTCPQDIHAVLREMSALLAEQGVELRHLQRENDAQAAKVRELEKLNQEQAGELTAIKARTEVTEKQVEALRTETEAQAAKLMELEKLNQQVKEQARELTAIKARTNVTENQVEALRTETEVRRVAFTATLSSGETTIGPFNTHTNLIFPIVISNIGNAYNMDTGFFIAPVKGAYHFELHIGAHGNPSHPSGAWLVRNGHNICLAYEHQTSGYGSTANGATLLLEVGDVLFVRLHANSRVYANENNHNTFSGHLLFTM